MKLLPVCYQIATKVLVRNHDIKPTWSQGTVMIPHQREEGKESRRGKGTFKYSNRECGNCAEIDVAPYKKQGCIVEVGVVDKWRATKKYL